MPVSEEGSADVDDADLATKDRPHLVLTEEDAKLFSAALGTPPAPTPRALKAAAAYRRRVVHAD